MPRGTRRSLLRSSERPLRNVQAVGAPDLPPFFVPGVMRVWVGESVRYQGFAQAAFAEAEAQLEP